jgi:ATP-dependent RNA helicase RhlE
MNQGFVHLDKIKYFVLDEADRMLDMGFIHDIKRILPKLPTERQTMFFSATMPESINKLSKTILRNPVRVEVTPAASVVDTISQALYRVEKPQKKLLLVEVLKKEEGKSVLVFSRTKHGADNISKILNKKGIACESIHGNKSQNARVRALTNFKEGRSNVIIATDIAARGIDIDQLDLVLNYDMPDVAETYVHRIGRTGRAGHEGRAISFCTSDEVPMLRDIEKLTGNRIPILKSDLPEMESQEATAEPVSSPQPRQETNKSGRRQRPVRASSPNAGTPVREHKQQPQRAAKPQPTSAKPRTAAPERRQQRPVHPKQAEPAVRNASKNGHAEPKNRKHTTEAADAKNVERLRSRYANTRGYE